jgi:hypothetical protein
MHVLKSITITINLLNPSLEKIIRETDIQYFIWSTIPTTRSKDELTCKFEIPVL